MTLEFKNGWVTKLPESDTGLNIIIDRLLKFVLKDAVHPLIQSEMRFVMRELLVNAVEASLEDPFPSVKVGFERDGDNSLTLEIENNGARFSQGPSLGGKGIGLRESRQILSRSGGSLRIIELDNGITKAVASFSFPLI